jgi:hypothetical protein
MGAFGRDVQVIGYSLGALRAGLGEGPVVGQAPGFLEVPRVGESGQVGVNRHQGSLGLGLLEAEIIQPLARLSGVASVRVLPEEILIAGDGVGVLGGGEAETLEQLARLWGVLASRELLEESLIGQWGVSLPSLGKAKLGELGPIVLG